MGYPRDIRVTFESGGRQQISACSNRQPLSEALARGGIHLNTRCGARGLCRGCEIELRDGSVMVGECTVTAPARIKACQAKLIEPIGIYISTHSCLEDSPEIGEAFEIATPYVLDPIFQPIPERQDTGFVVDVGTTTVVVLLVDLISGQVVSQAGGFNEQIRFGDNVIARIDAARDPRVLASMQTAIVSDTLAPLLLEAGKRAGRSMDRICGGTVAGNTTMLHILAGDDPSSLGFAPFTPRFLHGKQVRANEVSLSLDGLSRETPVLLLPAVSAYIGADIVAGILASGMIYDPRPALLVDIGTNGEMVLQSGGELLACSTAAGPAFEGCGLCCGTRASHGAVSALHLSLDPFRMELETIGDVPPSMADGVCGSAYVDFLASARQAGLLSTRGRFEPTRWETTPLANRLNEGGSKAIRLTNGNGRDGLRVTEADVAALLQAKAAIGVGIQILLESSGTRSRDLGQVYLAGGFGMHLNVANAIAIGLLPGIEEDQVRVIGNSALAGAYAALIDRNCYREMEKMRTGVKVFDLGAMDGFEDFYIEHLSLP